VLTAVGRVRLARGYVSGPAGGHYPADRALGVDGYVTAAAERMAVLAGARDAFARAAVALRELAGWELDGETVRRLTHACAARATATRADRPDAGRFAAAAGVAEVQIDAGKVNTDTGWRDVKVAVLARRAVGEPATPANWADRDLPAPTARTVVAAVEDCDAFAHRVRAEADRLGVTTAADVTVLADGAEWIWNLAADVVPQAAGVLDVYHAVEHVGTAVRAIWGEAAAAAARREAGRAALVAGGTAGLERWIADQFPDLPAGATGDELRDLAAYLAPHPTHLDYAGRLAAGRSIGSGLVEGSIKQLVNRRLKRTGARWRVDHVGPLVELAALVDTPDWHAFWSAA
jgi:hypothetical protein